MTQLTISPIIDFFQISLIVFAFQLAPQDFECTFPAIFNKTDELFPFDFLVIITIIDLKSVHDSDPLVLHQLSEPFDELRFTKFLTIIFIKESE